jgi:hypothetical protein
MTRVGELSPSDLRGETSAETDVVEIPVLLPEWQALALEDVAHQCGLTAGEMLRLLLADCLATRLCAGKLGGKIKTGLQVVYG